jgi:glycosyltransferase involved in cell wall biosynthesis
VTLDGGSGNRILLIAYHFPPSAAVGGMRMANFARWLPAFGWQPSVMTIQDKDIEHLDPERLRDVAGVTIHKVAVGPTLATMYGTIKTRLLGSPKDPSPSETKASPLSAPGSYQETLGQRLRRYVRSFAFFPDYERGWIIPAVVAAIRRLRRHRIEWIMTSCPPYSVHLIGLAVKIITGTKWIADFRDPWITAVSKRSSATCAASIRLASWLERKVIEKADLLLFNVERLRNTYRERYAHVPSGKFVFIPNGIDPRTLEAMEPVTKYETFTLSYTGSLYVRRSPEPVFQAISQLIQEGKTTPEAVHIKLVGHCRTVEGVPTASLIRKYGLESSVEVRDTLPYTEALEIVRRSQLALLFAPDLPFQIPAKVYDYLGAGARILAIAGDGGTSDLLHSTGAGQAFAAEDVEGIKSFIYQEMIGQKAASQGQAAGLARFDARRLTEELASHLDRVSVMGTTHAPHS